MQDFLGIGMGGRRQVLPGFLRASPGLSPLTGRPVGLHIPRLETETITATPTRTLDFTGKVAGSTVENPHLFRYKATNLSSLSDGPSAAVWTEYNQAAVDLIKTQDGQSRAYTVTTAGETAQVIFSYDLLTDLKRKAVIPATWTAADLKANITSLTVTWVGYGVGANAGAAANGANHKWWRVDTQVWSPGTSNTSNTPTTTTINSTPPTNFIDTNGVLHVLAHSTYPSDGTRPSTIYTDYVKVDVTVKREFSAGTITIEEQTTNLPTNPSFSEWSGGVPVGWFKGSQATVTEVPGWNGSGSAARLSTTSGGNNGLNRLYQEMAGLQPSTTYTITYRARRVTGAGRLYVAIDGTASGLVPFADTSGQWLSASGTVTTGSATSQRINFYTENANESFDIDDVQVEPKSYKTSLAIGTRAAETYSIPTAGILSPTQGTVEMWVFVDAVARRQVPGQFNRVFYMHKGIGGDGMYMTHSNSSAVWSVVSVDDTGAGTSVAVPDSYTPDGWHHFAVTWSTAEARVYIDGVLRGSVPAPKLPTAFGPSFYLGQSISNHLNARFADLRISSIVRSEAEIATLYASGQPAPVDQYTTFKQPFRRPGRSLVI